MSRYDLVVIGGGPGGEKAAVAAAWFGRRVALVDRDRSGPGGAMVHTGTLPSKTLRETALYLTGFERQELYGRIRCEFDCTEHGARSLMCRLDAVVGEQTAQIQQNLERHGVDVVRGDGRVLEAGRVQVGDDVLETDLVLIATGSRPRRPDRFDFDDPSVFDSDSILHLPTVPERMAIIGGGVVGSEYACVFAALGVQIELIERHPRLLAFLDHEVSDAIAAAMRAAGVDLLLDTTVERLERVGDRLRLQLSNGDEQWVDQALVSAGRTGNSAGLGLEALGVDIDVRGRIRVDDRTFRTSVPWIYAVGDVIGFPSLASAAMEQGRMAVAAMFELPVIERDWDTIPFGIYTIPEAAAVGPHEDQLRRDGTPYVVGRSQMRHNARGQIIGDTTGFVKLLFHAETRRLLGAHLVCDDATELIHIAQAVMRLDDGVAYFVESVLTYPSLSMAFKYAAYDALGKLAPGPGTPAPLR